MKNLIKKQNLYILIISFILLFFCIYFFNSINYTEDQDFVRLIKEMSIKNHNDPNLFLEIYNNATTEEEKVKAVLTNNFYECVHNYSDQIKTKTDVNFYCGNFIKF